MVVINVECVALLRHFPANGAHSFLRRKENFILLLRNSIPLF